jgi:hypothetical protein
MEAGITNHRISPDDIRKARKVFEANEPRDLFYRAATELVDLALRRQTSLTLAEALAVLLQTWNREYYRFRKFDNTHFVRIEALLLAHQAMLAACRNRSICDVKPQEKAAVANVFQAFEKVLGPVGAAKALHLLAPRFFPLWDRAIAEAYKVGLGVAGSNGDRYWKFVLIAQRQCEELSRADLECQNPLKSIDEFNYCKHTKKWLM